VKKLDDLNNYNELIKIKSCNNLFTGAKEIGDIEIEYLEENVEKYIEEFGTKGIEKIYIQLGYLMSNLQYRRFKNL